MMAPPRGTAPPKATITRTKPASSSVTITAAVAVAGPPVPAAGASSSTAASRRWNWRSDWGSAPLALVGDVLHNLGHVVRLWVSAGERST